LEHDDFVDFGFKKVSKPEKARLVREHFETIADGYDLANTVASFGMHYLWKREAVRFLELEAGEKAIDVCGGTGDLAVLMAQKVGRSGLVVLTDINGPMIRTGKCKPTHAAEREKIVYVQSDTEEIAIRPSTFDAAIAGFGIRNLVDMRAGLREIYRLLRPGGRFVCLEFSHPPKAWFRMLYDLYSFRVMPHVTRIVLGSRKPFLHLSQSIRVFPGPDEFSRILTREGFRDVAYRLLTHGIVAMHKGRK
jgi:demethylmenaquinone methyltransferase / 2-methoxy-6-polyprenyl-1,4-benzoquinol methylase